MYYWALSGAISVQSIYLYCCQSFHIYDSYDRCKNSFAIIAIWCTPLSNRCACCDKDHRLDGLDICSSDMKTGGRNLYCSTFSEAIAMIIILQPWAKFHKLYKICKAALVKIALQRSANNYAPRNVQFSSILQIVLNCKLVSRGGISVKKIWKEVQIESLNSPELVDFQVIAVCKSCSSLKLGTKTLKFVRFLSETTNRTIFRWKKFFILYICYIICLLIDIDECADKDAQLCEGNMKCFNSPGSFKCECDHGFLPDTYKTCKGWKFRYD